MNAGTATDGAHALERAIGRAQQNLLRQQREDGHWRGELIVDATLCADYLFYMHWSGRVDPVLEEQCVDHIRRRQGKDGGWPIYHGGPGELNATVKAYLALKLAGDAPDSPWMQEARAAALRLGGIPRTNTYTKFYLALLGQFPWQHLPSIAVEITLMPSWAPLSLYEISSWSRAILVPLAILHHLKPVRHLPAELHVHELYPAGLEHSDLSFKRDRRFWSARNFFLLANQAAGFLGRGPLRGIRTLALRRSVSWMTERMGPESEGLATVFPAMLNSIMALEALGDPSHEPLLAKARVDFEGLFVHDPTDFRIQPCLSPVWDTALNLVALIESGMQPTVDLLAKGRDWLVHREVRISGDWTRKNPHPEASGWAFEYRNDYYPDTDDTMMVLLALRFFSETGDSEAMSGIFARAIPWLLSFQCHDGGWAAFDKDVTQPWLEQMPFADHNAILDPPCSDLTGRMLELLGQIGFDPQDPAVRSAIAFLKRTQEPDGSWQGRWGVNYLYGTWQVLRGVFAIGEDMRQDWIVRARDWLLSCQNEDGGWGESCASYDDPALKGRGDSTPSQTSWAIMGLCASGDVHSKAVGRGVDYLIRTQNMDGSWDEPQTTGTGFPKVFYLKYDMYRQNFPLLALATVANYRIGSFHAKSAVKIRG